MPKPPNRARTGNYAYAQGWRGPLWRDCPDCDMKAGDRCVQYARDEQGVSYIRRVMTGFHPGRKAQKNPGP